MHFRREARASLLFCCLKGKARLLPLGGRNTVAPFVRQVAGAVARRIVTYATEGQECYIDNHMGFIKFGSRVDVYLPLDTDVKVALGQATTGNQTIIAMLKDKA